MASQLRDIHEALMGTAYGQPGLVDRVKKVEAKAETTGKLVEKFGMAWSAIIIIASTCWSFILEGIKSFFQNPSN